MRQNLNRPRRRTHTMKQPTTPQTMLTTRRDFLKTSSRALAGAALAAPLATPTARLRRGG